MFQQAAPKTLNAIPTTNPDEPAAARTARHLRMCRELAELGMEMARNAAQAARQEWANTPEPTEQPNPQPTPAPQATKPQAARSSNPQSPHTAPHRDTTSPTLAFTRLVHAIRQIIALEAELAAAQQAGLEKAARIASDHVLFGRLQTEPQPNPPTPAHIPPTPRQATSTNRDTTAEIPSMLANLSREIGVNLEDPTQPNRLPRFRANHRSHQTDPPD